MVAPFDEFSTAEEVLSGHDLRGRRVLITGISSGLGVETARVLSRHGAVVVGTARDVAKAEDAISRARGAEHDIGTVQFAQLDLASLSSVREFATALVEENEIFDLVIANAGIMACPFGTTADGFEMQFGTNHLGHFVLVNRILGLLRPGSRVVILSSAAHRMTDVNLDDPNFSQTPYDPWLAYGRSKTANALFAVAFDGRYRECGIRATAVHPGGVATGLNRYVGQETIQAGIDAANAKLVAEGKPPYRSKSVPQGAATTVWAGVVAPAEEIGGRYCENCHVTENVAESPLPPTGEGVQAYALDLSNANALWAKSQELVGESYQ